MSFTLNCLCGFLIVSPKRSKPLDPKNSMIFGRTELIIGESGAENRQDSVGKIRFLVAPQKCAKSPKNFAKIFEKFAIERLTSRKTL